MENLLRIVIQDDGRPPPRPAAPSTAPASGTSLPPAPSPPRAAVPTIPPVPPPRPVIPAVPPPPAEFRPGIDAFDEIFNPTAPPAPKLYEPPAAEPSTDPLSAALGGITADLGDALRRLAEQVTDTTRSLAGADDLTAALGSLADESDDLGDALKRLAEQATEATVAPQVAAPPAAEAATVATTAEPPAAVQPGEAPAAEPVYGFRDEPEAAAPPQVAEPQPTPAAGPEAPPAPQAATPQPETFGFAQEPEPEVDTFAVEMPEGNPFWRGREARRLQAEAEAPIPLADEPIPYQFAEESPKVETPGPAETEEPIPLAGDTEAADTYRVKPHPSTPIAPESSSPLFQQTAAGINQLAEANRQLQESLGDGSYLRQMKELIQLRDEELKLAREAADQELKARYGDNAPDSKTLSGIGQVMDAGPSWLKPVIAGIGGGKGGTLGAAADLAGAGGEAGLAGAMEAAGGPIGLVAAAAQAASAALDGMERGVERAGQGLTALAGNDGLGMLHAATGAVTDSLRQIPIVGDFFAKQIELATTAVTVYTQVTEAFIQRGQELSRFSGDLAGANAVANAKRLEADIKESEALGKSLSRLTENQSDVENNLRELVLPIKEGISDLLAAFSEDLKEFTSLAKEAAPVIKFFVKVALFLPTETLELIGVVLKQLNEWLTTLGLKSDDRPPPGQLNSMMQNLFAMLDKMPNQPKPGQAQATSAPLGPMLGGV